MLLILWRVIYKYLIYPIAQLCSLFIGLQIVPSLLTSNLQVWGLFCPLLCPVERIRVGDALKSQT